MVVTLSGTVFIDRTNRSSALKTFDNAVKQMKRDKVHPSPSLLTFQQSVWIFPEGTRSHADNPMLLPFKKGAFHFAIQAGVPIVPIVVANYSRLFSVKKRRFEAGTVKIRGSITLNHTDLVMEPISTTDLTSADVDRMAVETRERMLTVLEDISEKTRSTNGQAINGGSSLKKEL